MTQDNGKYSDWPDQAAAAEAEIESRGIFAGRPRSPDNHPIQPVLEDEAAIRKFLAEKFKQMQQREADRIKRFQENRPIPNVVVPTDAVLGDFNYTSR